MDKFSTWLDVFLEEKGLDQEDTFTLLDANDTEHFMSYGVVVEYLKNIHIDNQKQVKNKLVQIDFQNGDVKRFLRFLGEHIISKV